MIFLNFKNFKEKIQFFQLRKQSEKFLRQFRDFDFLQKDSAISKTISNQILKNYFRSKEIFKKIQVFFTETFRIDGIIFKIKFLKNSKNDGS